MASDGNSRISLIGLVFSSGYGSTLTSSGVSAYLTSSGHGDMSSFKVPGIHLYFLITVPGRLSSGRNLYRSSSLIFSDS